MIILKRNYSEYQQTLQIYTYLKAAKFFFLQNQQIILLLNCKLKILVMEQVQINYKTYEKFQLVQWTKVYINLKQKSVQKNDGTLEIISKNKNKGTKIYFKIENLLICRDESVRNPMISEYKTKNNTYKQYQLQLSFTGNCLKIQNLVLNLLLKRVKQQKVNFIICLQLIQLKVLQIRQIIRIDLPQSPEYFLYKEEIQLKKQKTPKCQLCTKVFKIKHLNQMLKKIIIMCSAVDTEENCREGEAVGMSEFLPKLNYKELERNQIDLVFSDIYQVVSHLFKIIQYYFLNLLMTNIRKQIIFFISNFNLYFLIKKPKFKKKQLIIRMKKKISSNKTHYDRQYN
ncbi:unnamed protein product [Paramecium sonneborni]|uniref:Uncharacterized protein n=1 Tax=Paramecium sonneborni TaxID=65129 RepID=A0A8S1N3H1_9CILI|nr:unnamed protein product [Paramecium sonneborni]